MKKTDKTSNTADYLEKIFRVLNDHYFDRKLEEPIITLSPTPDAYGHVTIAPAWKVGTEGKKLRELNIDSGELDRPIEGIVTTMLHEMVHLLNLQNGVADCSRNGYYHNKRFKAVAETVDLQMEYDKRYGWCDTKPTKALIDFVSAQGWKNIQMSRNAPIDDKRDADENDNPAEPDAEPPAKRKSSTRKLICPKCGQSVRATKKVNILCGDCMETMIEA